ncbi:MAG: hypothetical protein GC205_01815 [Bacteroidetes bacterium]|nr:hypothetical protein [Bacteroidota bacterium]
MRTLILPAALVVLTLQTQTLPLSAQICDPTSPPINLTSTVLPGTGVQLRWDAVPGSAGVQVQAISPGGSNINRRLLGFERDRITVAEALLEPGTYQWRVQAACSATTPFDLTPISAPANFVVSGASTCPASVSDVEGNVYATVSIGGQCWMADNLRTTQYRDGDAIPTGLSDAAWSSTAAGAMTVYNNDPVNVAQYGRLYNAFSIADARGICPVGWHVPTDAEWTVLTDGLGGEAIAGNSMKVPGNIALGTGPWIAQNLGATNASGFGGLPGGYRGAPGDYQWLQFFGYWWTSTPNTTLTWFYRGLDYDKESVTRSVGNDNNGFSVRCLKDG